MVEEVYNDQAADALASHRVAGAGGALSDAQAMVLARLRSLQAAPLQPSDWLCWSLG